jgi:hypothetical protein
LNYDVVVVDDEFVVTVEELLKETLSYSMIISNASLSDNITELLVGHAMTDFCILKAFNVRNHQPKTPIITEIIWHPPPIRWVKCNSDGASKDNPSTSVCGGIFRDNQGNDLGCFASNLGMCDAFSVGLIGVITTIEIVQKKVGIIFDLSVIPSF